MPALQTAIVAELEAQALLRELALVFLDFERKLSKISLIRKLEDGTFSKANYLTLLRNLRPQVVEGSRWITRAASSFDRDFRELRSKVIGHAYDEHRDYEMLERDYVFVGGRLEDIINAPRNLGTEALTAFLMHMASQPNPIALLGAMFIIEGLGEKMASRWAKLIQRALKLQGEEGTTFLSYHGQNDDNHIAKMHEIIKNEPLAAASKDDIVKTAKVVARLYLLQLEEIE